ncbi:MAG: hypothetical protein H6687_01980 [Bacillales bacterium]|nr:hypothetical protein [Bacillales bacterium]
MNKIRKNLQTSVIFSLLIAISFSILLILSIFIGIYYDYFVNAIYSQVSTDFADLLDTMGRTSLFFLYFLILIMTVPFLLQSVINIAKTNKIERKEKIDKELYIELIKNLGFFMMFALAFVIGWIIAYISLSIGNFLFMIPCIVLFSLYFFGCLFKFLALKEAKRLFLK